MRRLILSLLCTAALTAAQNVDKVHLGFPEAWDGDQYKELYCPSKNIPRFLDGFFLCQLSAAYGNSSAPAGHKLNHMIDAIGAIGAFRIRNGQVTFNAEYYPSRPYKIWEFYDRNMSKSSVPWAGWSDYNISAMARWEQVPNNNEAARFHPNLDFWKVGKKIVAGTEAPYWVGYEFDVNQLNKFKLFPFTESNDVFATPRSTMIPISMAIHERSDADGTIWGTFSAMNFDDQRFYQGIFTVDENGVRKVVGIHDYGAWDATACGKDDEYIGDKTMLPGYVHSITSTENFIVLPVTSLLINPCKFKEPPMTNFKSSIQSGGLWGMDFYDMVPMRFIIFNKKTKEFMTSKPLEVFPSMFVTHQLNAYENMDGTITADMVVYENHDPYVKYFYTDFLTSQLYPSTARLLRFTLDAKEHRVMYNYLVPQETIAADFPQVNHAYDGRPYQWAYIVVHPFAADNRILKMNVDDASGARNVIFKSEPQLVLHEPWFVARPDAKKEDDGVLLVRALDINENKGLLLVIDAATMTELGRAYVPISIPFGFHNRFFASADLGLPDAESEEAIRQALHRPEERAIVNKPGTTMVGQQPKATLPTSRPRLVPVTPTTASFPSSTTVKRTLPTERPATTTTTTTTERSTPASTTPVPTTTTPKTTTAAPSTTTTPKPTTTPSTTIAPTTAKATTPSSTTTTTPIPATTTAKATTTATAEPSTVADQASTARWWPMPTEEPAAPWWRKVQQGKNAQTPLFPPEIVVTAQPKSTEAAIGSAAAASKVEIERKSSMSALYDETLKALCKWLPSVVSLITPDTCLQQADRAAKYIAPIATDYADKLRAIPSRLRGAQDY